MRILETAEEEAPAADEAQLSRRMLRRRLGKNRQQKSRPKSQQRKKHRQQRHRTERPVLRRVSISVRRRTTDSDRIALAYQGDAITQIESYDNGWSKVEYKGETGYVKTEFLE